MIIRMPRIGLWLRRRYVFGGLVVALVFFLFSLTPSLLPRGPLFQGLVSGAAAAIGYGFGVLGSWVVRGVTSSEPSARAKSAAWWGLAIVAVVGGVVSLIAFARWQDDIRDVMDATPFPLWGYLVVALLAGLVFVGFVGAARGLRRASRWTGRQVGRVAPPRVAAVVGAVAVAALLVGLINGVVVGGAMSALNASFRELNSETTAGTAEPALTEVSGSAGSYMTWDSLGRKGRDFIGNTPLAAEIKQFSGKPAKQPIRVYAGLASADDIHAEADLVVRELERTGGFDRAVLGVATTTGTGWVNENSSGAIEFISNGDSALASMQYSYLPSWISFMVDQARARAAGQALFEAVYAKWSTLPADDRPKLVVYGESLGSFGGEAAFGGLGDVRARTDGAVFVGPPNSNELWGSIVARRDRGTPERLPVYDAGLTVRFGSSPSDVDVPPGPWAEPRMVYLQHASDPIVWWSPRLLFKKPDWLKESRGDDVLAGTRWMPVVTFLQVSADMAVADGVPDGHGHRYGLDVVDPWVDVLQPAGWTDADTVRLRAAVDAREVTN